MAIKKIITLLSLMFLMIFCATAATAAPQHRGPSDVRSDHAPEASVYFFPQDMDTYNDMFRFNAWGLMHYRLWGEAFQFSFEGHKLNRRTSYALIYYPEEAGIVILGSGVANRGGELKIAGRVDICTLPSTMDTHYFYGARLMLVPLDSLVPDEGVLLTPGSEENLISYHPIRFTNTDECSVDVPPSEEPADNSQTSEDPPAEENNDGTDGTSPSTDDEYDNDPNIVYPY